MKIIEMLNVVWGGELDRNSVTEKISAGRTSRGRVSRNRRNEI